MTEPDNDGSLGTDLVEFSTSQFAEETGWYPQVTSGSKGSFSLFSAAMRRLKNRPCLSRQVLFRKEEPSLQSIRLPMPSSAPPSTPGGSVVQRTLEQLLVLRKCYQRVLLVAAAVFSSASVPVASIRSPTTATACAVGFVVSSVTISFARVDLYFWQRNIGCPSADVLKSGDCPDAKHGIKSSRATQYRLLSIFICNSSR